METFREIIKAIGTVPVWVPLLIYPSVLVVFAVLVLTLGGRRAYPYVAAALGGAAFALLCCSAEISEAFVFLGMYAVLAFVLKLFFFLPPPKRRKRGERVKNKDERMFQKFHEELSVRAPKSPPMVCKFEEEEERVSLEESGMRLQHAEELLRRLKTSPLSPSDRLETDVLTRSLDNYRERALGSAELRSLNDCLASILKLTAKYKL